MRRFVVAATLFGLVSLASGQTSLPGDPVTISGKLGVGTSTPSKKIDVRTSAVWDGIQIIGTQPDGGGAYFGMRSTGGTNRMGLDLYADSRPDADSLVFQTGYPFMQFWTLYGTPVQVMRLSYRGDVEVAGDVFSRGVKLGPPGAVIAGPPGPAGPIGPQGPKGDPGGVSTLNGIAGALKIVAGANVSVTPNSSLGTITISSVPSCTTVARNITGSGRASCGAGFVAVAASSLRSSKANTPHLLGVFGIITCYRASATRQRFSVILAPYPAKLM
jgi:hypothetical protein